MRECGYEFSEDYYTEGHACELELGHAGPHLCVLAWETRPADICRTQGHQWGEWAPWKEPTFFMRSEWKVKPTRQRQCGRCGAWDHEGGERNKDISDILLDSLLGGPRVVPAGMPIAEFKV